MAQGAEIGLELDPTLVAVAVGVDYETLPHARFGGCKASVNVAMPGDEEFQVGQLPFQVLADL